MKYNLTAPLAEMKDGMATTTGWVTVYPIDPVTHEFLGATLEHVVAGSSPSAGSFLDAPELKPGMAILRDQDGWIYVEDHRGEIYWVKATKQKVVVQTVGALSEDFTKIEPKANECWGEDTWVIDPEYVKDQLNEEKGFIQDLILKKSLPVRTRVALGLGTKEDTDILASLGTYLEDVLGTEVVGSSYTLPQMPAFLTV